MPKRVLLVALPIVFSSFSVFAQADFSGSWPSDKKKFTEISQIYSPTDAGKIDHTVTNTYLLSDEEKTLNLDRKDENFSNGEV